MTWKFWERRGAKAETAPGAFTEETAMVMASLQYMIDVSAFSRTSDDPDTPEFEIRRTPRPSARNVTTAPLPVSRDATRKIAAEAVALGEAAGVEHPPAAIRECTEKLLSHLQSTYGNEGAKRHAEAAYIALRTEGSIAWAMLWANLRTMMDVERFTKIGRPFIVEHYLGDLFVVSDRAGARIEHIGGAAMSFPTKSTTYRDEIGY